MTTSLDFQLIHSITDDELINCGFDLAFYYCLVSYYTDCAQHSSDKIAKCIYLIKASTNFLTVHELKKIEFVTNGESTPFPVVLRS